jgi:Protein of unknown function (DUF2878)
MIMPWSKILNAVGYQVVWFACIYSASRGNAWLGFTASVIFSIVMLAFAGRAKDDIRILSIGLCLGVCIDSIFASSGLIKYDAAWPIEGIAPLWIMALWLSFSLTLNHSMAFLRNNVTLAAAFGLIGGPLAYFGADRLFNVLDFGGDTLTVVLALAVAWAVAIPAIFWIDQRIANPQKLIIKTP